MRSSDFPVINIPKHLHSLDALRGMAALTVVLWHWQHFFSYTIDIKAKNFDPSFQPFYFLFKPFYLDAWRAVDLFFCLSGFIFFWLYAEKIKQQKTSLKEFFILRLSRLYPLHLATFLFVAIAQQFMVQRYGAIFVYPHNDFFHFNLHLFFASHWGFEKGDSFNGPAWSVSVEILLYAIFFLICRLNLLRWWHLVIYIMIGFAIAQVPGHELFGRGLVSFFVGGITFYGFHRILQQGFSRKALQYLGSLTVALWIILPFNTQNKIIYHFYQDHLWRESLNFKGKDVIGDFLILKVIPHISFELIMFPLAVITLALWEVKRGSLGKRLAVLGDISYSSYLLHFPLQIVALYLAGSDTVFKTPLALICFYAVLLPLSLCSYKFLERPCQSLLRSWLLPRSSYLHAKK